SVPTDSKAEEDDGLAGIEFLQDDNQLLDQARSAENGVKFQRLWEGDDALHNGDRSAADLALCDILAFWTGKDVSRMDRLFRRSERRRDKWDQTHSADGRTYGAMTLAKAIQQCKTVYDPQYAQKQAEAADAGPI